jgi:hypothetical protein
LDPDALNFLMRGVDRCEVVMQWVQRLIKDALESGVVNIPAPILSRVFQELSRGIVNVRNVQKIAEIPFPFPYTQMIMVMLILQTMLTPLLAAVTSQTAWWAVLMTFITVLSFWCLNYIASEIEQPFGEDHNDLPIPEMLKDMNKSLRMLLRPETQNCPVYIMKSSGIGPVVKTKTCLEAKYTTLNKELVAGFAKNRSQTLAKLNKACSMRELGSMTMEQAMSNPSRRSSYESRSRASGKRKSFTGSEFIEQDEFERVLTKLNRLSNRSSKLSDKEAGVDSFDFSLEAEGDVAFEGTSINPPPESKHIPDQRLLLAKIHAAQAALEKLSQSAGADRGSTGHGSSVVSPTFAGHSSGADDTEITADIFEGVGLRFLSSEGEDPGGHAQVTSSPPHAGLHSSSPRSPLPSPGRGAQTSDDCVDRLSSTSLPFQADSTSMTVASSAMRDSSSCVGGAGSQCRLQNLSVTIAEAADVHRV